LECHSERGGQNVDRILEGTQKKTWNATPQMLNAIGKRKKKIEGGTDHTNEKRGGEGGKRGDDENNGKGKRDWVEIQKTYRGVLGTRERLKPVRESGKEGQKTGKKDNPMGEKTNVESKQKVSVVKKKSHKKRRGGISRCGGGSSPKRVGKEKIARNKVRSPRTKGGKELVNEAKE